MRKNRPFMGLVTLCVMAALAMFAGPVAMARSPGGVGLGDANVYAVLAGSTVTNTGDSVINGALGVSPGNAVTGFPPGDVNGTIHRGDGNSARAQDSLTTAYNRAAGRTPVTTVGTQLGGRNLKTGVYDSSSGTFKITGSLTLDAEGDPDAVFIFHTASTLITASSSRVRLVNGANACNIFWKVGSSATLGTRTSFRGNILALTSITLNTGATVRGRVLARNGAVTLDSNTVTRAVCPQVPDATPRPTPRPTDRADRTPRPTDRADRNPGRNPTPAPTRKPIMPPTDTIAMSSGGGTPVLWLALAVVGMAAGGWAVRRRVRRDA